MAQLIWRHGDGEKVVTMKIKYYVGDPNIPWWVNKLVDCGLIDEVRENAAITFFLTYKTTFTDTEKYYLYDGDYLELDEETGAVTIGLADWARALADDFQKVNWDKFVGSLRKTVKDNKRKEENEANYYSNYWA